MVDRPEIRLSESSSWFYFIAFYERQEEVGILKKIAQYPLELFHPYRMLIMRIMGENGDIPIEGLRRNLGISFADLNGHLRVLEKEYYVKLSREIIDGKPRKVCSIAVEGIRFVNELIPFTRNFEHSNPLVPLGKVGRWGEMSNNCS